jgi:hypothetical protein
MIDQTGRHLIVRWRGSLPTAWRLFRPISAANRLLSE